MHFAYIRCANAVPNRIASVPFRSVAASHGTPQRAFPIDTLNESVKERRDGVDDDAA
jgi:hypothetical protein